MKNKVTAIITFLVGILITVTAYCGQSHPLELCGRWQSNVWPTGYWVIDRYPDGTFVQKAYEAAEEYSGEILIEWGKWDVRGKTYYYQITGSTTSRPPTPAEGKLYKWPILERTPTKFTFEPREGSWTETRLDNHIPILQLQMSPPEQVDYKSFSEGSGLPKSWNDTTHKPSTPNWVLESTGIPTAKAVPDKTNKQNPKDLCGRWEMTWPKELGTSMTDLHPDGRFAMKSLQIVELGLQGDKAIRSISWGTWRIEKKGKTELFVLDIQGDTSTQNPKTKKPLPARYPIIERNFSSLSYDPKTDVPSIKLSRVIADRALGDLALSSLEETKSRLIVSDSTLSYIGEIPGWVLNSCPK